MAKDEGAEPTALSRSASDLSAAVSSGLGSLLAWGNPIQGGSGTPTDTLLSPDKFALSVSTGTFPDYSTTTLNLYEKCSSSGSHCTSAPSSAALTGFVGSEGLLRATVPELCV